MSRAYNIHIVTYAPGVLPDYTVLAAFTVKHEMDTWIANQTLDNPDFMDDVEIITRRDGAPRS